MTEKTVDIGNVPEGNICKFLGLKEDPATHMAYPSEWNTCHHSHPGATPTLDHQRQVCLLKTHTGCPVYVNQEPANLPDDIRMVVRKHRRRMRKKTWLAYIMVAVVIAGILAGTRLLTRPLSFLASHQSIIPSETVPTGFVIINPNLVTQSASQVHKTPQFTETTLPKPSVTPLLGTETPTKTIRGLDMPIGNAHRFVIHRIQQGESLGGLAIQFNTTVEAITHVNYYMPDPVWINWLVVIPVDTSDVAGLPSFDAYMVVEGDLSIESLAEKLALDPDLLIFYNGLEPGYLTSSGEWLLIPHTGE